jgi:hypothetical protein
VEFQVTGKPDLPRVDSRCLMVWRKADVNRHRRLHGFAVKRAWFIAPLQNSFFVSFSQRWVFGKTFSRNNRTSSGSVDLRLGDESGVDRTAIQIMHKTIHATSRFRVQEEQLPETTKSQLAHTSSRLGLASSEMPLTLVFCPCFPFLPKVVQANRSGAKTIRFDLFPQ